MRKYMNNHFGYSRIFRHARFDVDPVAEEGSIEVDVAAGGGLSNESGSGDGDESLESLKQELARAKADAERFKNSISKLTKERAELTKKNRDMMSTDQLEKEAREEREKRFAEMEKELRANKYSKRLVGLGMAETDADAFALTLPEIEDADAFFDTLSKFIKAKEKAATDKAVQELLKSRPDINAGTGDANKDDPAMALAKASVEASKRHSATVNTDILKNYM